ncbi:hypothetical protein Tco_0158638 [Tanacetum coccineum]
MVSSSSGHRHVFPTHCKCGLRLARRISWTEMNPARRFLVCPRPWEERIGKPQSRASAASASIKIFTTTITGKSSGQIRINVIDVDDEITLVSVQDDADAEMFDVGTLTGDEVFAEQEVPAKCVNLTVDEVTLAQVLADLKSVKPKVKRDVIKEPSVPISAASASIKVSAAITKTAIIPTPRKGIVITELEITLKLQAEIDKEERIARAKEEKIDEANIAWDDIQAKVDADYQLDERLQVKEQEEFTIEEKDTLFKKTPREKKKTLCS